MNNPPMGLGFGIKNESGGKEVEHDSPRSRGNPPDNTVYVYEGIKRLCKEEFTNKKGKEKVEFSY
jgi:hypothetical protein